MADTKLVICEKCWGAGHVHGGEENSTWSKTCEDCHGIGFVRVPMTNADRIRAMSDEELAEFLADDNRLCPQKHPYGCKYVSSCNECFLEWLQQPSE